MYAAIEPAMVVGEREAAKSVGISSSALIIISESLYNAKLLRNSYKLGESREAWNARI